MHRFAADAAGFAMPALDSPWAPFVLCTTAAVLALLGAATLTGMWLGQRGR